MKGVTRVTASLLAAAMTAGLGTAATALPVFATGADLGDVVEDTTDNSVKTSVISATDANGNLLASTDEYERDYWDFANEKTVNLVDDLGETDGQLAKQERLIYLTVGGTKKINVALDDASTKAGNTVKWSYKDVVASDENGHVDTSKATDGKIDKNDVISTAFGNDTVDGTYDVAATTTSTPEKDVVSITADSTGATLTATKTGRAVVYAVASDDITNNNAPTKYVQFDIVVMDPTSLVAEFENRDNAFTETNLSDYLSTNSYSLMSTADVKKITAESLEDYYDDLGTFKPTASQIKYSGSKKINHVESGDTLNVDADYVWDNGADSVVANYEDSNANLSLSTLNPRYLTVSGLTATVTGTSPKDGVSALQAVYEYEYTDANNRKQTVTATSNYVLTAEHMGVEVHRLYNPNTGEHLYTIDDEEADYLPTLGWLYEGTAWYAPETSGDAVTRMFNPNNGGEHVYTTDAKEIKALEDAGWKNEGQKFYSASNTYFPIYRQYNPNVLANNHNYTGNVSERTMLVNFGWTDEGVKLYATELSADTIKEASDNIADTDD